MLLVDRVLLLLLLLEQEHGGLGDLELLHLSIAESKTRMSNASAGPNQPLHNQNACTQPSTTPTCAATSPKRASSSTLRFLAASHRCAHVSIFARRWLKSLRAGPSIPWMAARSPSSSGSLSICVSRGVIEGEVFIN